MGILFQVLGIFKGVLCITTENQQFSVMLMAYFCPPAVEVSLWADSPEPAAG